MTVRKRWKTEFRRCIGPLAAASAMLLVGCTLEQFPQSTLHPHSNYARAIQDLLEQLAFWVVVIFVAVMALLIYALVRFRSRPGAADPKPVHGHTLLEIAWTIAPAIILTLVAVPTVLTIYQTQAAAPPGAIQVTVIGHQWWWEFRYPELGVTTANEMHVPVGKPVNVTIESADVLHSFWFPVIGGKRDAVPSRANRLWFTADTVGTFPGQCAELCGVSHANMRMKLMIEAPEDFDAWVAQQKAPAVSPDSTTAAGRGKQIFSQSACIACHTVQGVSAGVLGPNLTHVGSRSSIAGGMFDSNAEHLGQWIKDAPAMKPGSLMPKLDLPPDQIAALVAYLQSLK